MIQYLFASFMLSTTGSLNHFNFGNELNNQTTIQISKSWSQEPNGWEYPIEIKVPETSRPESGFPVCILLHGGGGIGDFMINDFEDTLSCHILIAPTGYLNSWNICSETSDAPDIEMIDDLVNELQKYSNVDPNRIRILGFSNGSALANSIYISNSNNGLDAVCTIVSHLADTQARLGNFYIPSNQTSYKLPFCGYDTIVTPILNRKYLNIANENDPIIPYDGGFSPVGVGFYLQN